MKVLHTSLLSQSNFWPKKISDPTVEAVVTVSTLSAVMLKKLVAKQVGLVEEKIIDKLKYKQKNYSMNKLLLISCCTLLLF